MTFKFQKVANMVYLVSECDVIFNSWMACDFTKRKMENAIAKLKTCYNGNVCFVFDGV